MAKTENKSHKYPKLKGSIFLRCFGSPDSNIKVSIETTIKGSDSIPKEKRTRWFSWKKIQIKKKSTSKTVPFEPSVPVKAHYSKLRSKSTLQHKSQAPATSPPPPIPPPPVLTVTPYSTPTQTRHDGSNNIEDTRQETSEVSPKHAKRHVRRLQKTYKPTTTSYDSVIGISIVMVTMVMMIFWGRLCAIVCTSAWLYFISRSRLNVTKNDDNKKLNDNLDLDVDSELYKKKVIMEGLLNRTRRRSNSTIEE
ncbi:hypothetical protein TanjilG_31057 [Lupinus angustifolius]|uniref:Uncharacterized protein n=1 Tax=Lupinus angustifolius TaxID=3871 RepID=A0A4P1R4W1_LUPAN|nr:PREDICTED: uncharacterized protein At5g23160-like [Lupinus angustifolius]OIW01875.1 hypothetical protein TanjilG_31057 [Lupinus angustifolius]